MIRGQREVPLSMIHLSQHRKGCLEEGLWLMGNVSIKMRERQCYRF